MVSLLVITTTFIFKDTNKIPAGENGQQQDNDTFDDGLFEDDVLSLIDEVECKYILFDEAHCLLSPIGHYKLLIFYLTHILLLS